MKALFLGVSACLLAACANREMAADIREGQQQAYYERCLSYGAMPGTPAFDMCMGEDTVETL